MIKNAFKIGLYDTVKSFGYCRMWNFEAGFNEVKYKFYTKFESFIKWRIGIWNDGHFRHHRHRSFIQIIFVVWAKQKSLITWENI